ncbi:MAG: Dockerin protein [Patescibacteria group bacterium]|nr:Dockerin protein [Patescibacteria group bacterium]MDQ5961972.1 Dockerin protein [Patescibacteria group bacterium]
MKQFFLSFLLILTIVSGFPQNFAKAQVSENLNITAEVVDTSDPGDDGSGGGSNGTGGIFTGVKFLGRAYPLSTVVILRDGQQITSTVAGLDARFEVLVSGLSPSVYTFSVISEDSFGRRSALFTFPLTITQGVFATISGIFLPPTIDTNNIEVKKGDKVAIFGQTVPNSNVTINVNSIAPNFFEIPADNDGVYLFELDTSILEYGDYFAKSKAVYSNETSQFGKLTYFKVGKITKAKDISSTTYAAADFNQDGYVNIVDFSILAYWYKKQNSPVYVDLNSDTMVTVVDFSIMAFYWTG